MIARIFTIFSLLVGIMCAAAPLRAESLNDVLAATYRNNPVLLAQRARVRATDEGVPQALSNWRPTIEASVDAGMSAVRNYGASGTGRGQHRNPRSLSVTLSQPVFRGGRTLFETQKAENSVRAERARLEVTEQKVLLEAVTSYMDVLRDQKVLKLNISNEMVLTRQLKITKKRFSVGDITRTDVNQAETRLARATANRVQSEGALENSRAAYRSVVGQLPGTLERPPLPDDLPHSLGTAVKDAAANDPAVVASEYDNLSLRDNVDAIRGEFLPEISLDGTAKRDFDSTGENSRISTYEGMVTLTMPLYQSGSVYSRLREARQSLAEQRRKTEQARRNAVKTATQAWHSLQTARTRIKSFDIGISSSRVALDGVRREATVGSRTVLDVLDAEQEFLNAKVSRVRAGREEVVAAFELKASIGRLTAQYLTLSVNIYNPNDHYHKVREKWFGLGSDSKEYQADNLVSVEKQDAILSDSFTKDLTYPLIEASTKPDTPPPAPAIASPVAKAAVTPVHETKPKKAKKRPPEEPTPPAAKIKPVQVPALPTLRYQVQLASMNTEKNAHKAWDNLKNSNQDILADLTPVFMTANLNGKGRLYRLRVDFSAKRVEARALCNELKKRRIACYVVREQ